MRFYQTLLVGLLGLASGPIQGLVTGHVIGNAVAREAARVNDFLEKRITVSWDKPRVKLSQIKKGLSEAKAVKVKPEEDAAKKISTKDWFIKANTDKFANEIKVYQSIEGKGIGPPVLALIEAENSNDVIGFAIDWIQGSTPGNDDKKAVVDVILRLHSAGWAHLDAHKGNFIKAPDGKLYLIDFEEAKEYDSDGEEEDFQRLDEEFGISDDEIEDYEEDGEWE